MFVSMMHNWKILKIKVNLLELINMGLLYWNWKERMGRRLLLVMVGWGNKVIFDIMIIYVYEWYIYIDNDCISYQ